MKQVVQTARNIRHAIHDGKIETEIELIFTTVEPRYELGGSRMNAVDQVKTHRFSLCPEAARALSKTLVGYADEAEVEAERLTLASEVQE